MNRKKKSRTILSVNELHRRIDDVCSSIIRERSESPCDTDYVKYLERRMKGLMVLLSKRLK